MTTRIVCFWATLFQLAAKAARTGDPEDVRRHEEYRDLCLDADEVRFS